MSQSGDLDQDIDEKSSRKKYLTWIIIGVIIVAVIAIPMVLMRQTDPTEATEPATIGQLEAEIDALYLTVYGTDEVEGLETKLALQAEVIADFQSGDCTCPDHSGDIASINSDLLLLRTDLNAIPDYASNITGLLTDLDALSADLTVVQTSLTELQVEVDAIAVTDWTSDIDALNSAIGVLDGKIGALDDDIASLQSQVDALAGLESRIGDLEVAIDSLPNLPRYAVVMGMTAEYLEVAVVGAGSYPVIVTLYDLEQGLALDQVWEVYPANYDIIDEMLYANGKILALFIIPDDDWEATDTITLVIYSISESIDYATASVGG